jgi:hypothetical protein
MRNLTKFIAILLFLLLLLLLNSCKSPGVEFEGESYYVRITSQNQLTHDDLTLDTKNFLTTNALDVKYQESPKAVIKTCFHEINKKESKVILEHNYRHTLKVLIELCINEAKSTSGDESIKYWMTVSYLSYRYLYDTAILPPLNKLKFPWTGTVEKYYNFSLYKIFTYLQDQKLLNDKGFEIKMVSGSVRFNTHINTMPWGIDTFKQFLICYNYKPVNFNEIIFKLGVGLPICGIPSDFNFETVSIKARVIKYLYPCNFALQFHNVNEKTNRFNVTPIYMDFYKSAYTEIDKNKIQLSNNYTTIIGKFLEKYPQETEASYFFDPGNMINKDIDGIYMLSPFDKNKIPVLLIHGLISDPQSLSQIYNTLMQSNIIRENYQFWFYFYPTGQPILLDSFALRKSLNALYEKYAVGDTTKFDKMVVVGYSLGGLVAQLLVQGSKGDFLEKKVFFTELKELDIDKKHKEMLEDMLNFKPLPYIKQVIFISTPHKGAEMAAWVSSQLLGDLVVSPNDYYKEYKNTLMFISKFTRSYNDRVLSGNALDNLRPRSPFIALTNELPYGKGIELNSIIGDASMAGNIGGTDGIVPYRSSHLNNSKSETIIKSDHHSVYKPACAKEVYRLLLNNLKVSNTDK